MSPLHARMVLLQEPLAPQLITTVILTMFCPSQASPTLAISVYVISAVHARFPLHAGNCTSLQVWLSPIAAAAVPEKVQVKGRIKTRAPSRERIKLNIWIPPFKDESKCCGIAETHSGSF